MGHGVQCCPKVAVKIGIDINEKRSIKLTTSHLKGVKYQAPNCIVVTKLFMEKETVLTQG